jgi:protein-tyrosine kinase
MDPIVKAVERARGTGHHTSVTTGESSTIMDPIVKAVERARATGPHSADQYSPRPAGGQPSAGEPKSSQVIQLDRAHLEGNRIVAHDAADARSRPFDILRTQILHQMDKNRWQFLAVTSPRAGCGKTLTAINLALSISRLPERSVFLMDLDLHKPELLSSLGVTAEQGVVGILGGKYSLSETVVEVRAGSTAIKILPAERRVVDPSELISGRPMRTLLQDIKAAYPSNVVIIDLPPMLATDDVLALMPQIDCALLVAAVGNSSVSDIKTCNMHLHSTPLLKVVLNKSTEPIDQYEYY